jgi:GT2 family glycosyltransferase
MPENISVVTPTLGNPDLVALLLASTGRAGDQAGVPWEHIVVDSTPGEAGRAIARACEDHGARYLRGPRRVGAKRNAGARVARNEVLLFVDSDCVVDPDLFARHLSGYGPPQVGAVAGPTDMYGPEDSFALRVLRRAKQYNHCYTWPRRYREVGWSTTSNLSVRADVFRAVGGFSERTLTVVGGEDVDLGVRIRRRGHTIATDADAVVYHTRTLATRLIPVMRRVFLYGQADGWLCRRHPDLTTWYANPFAVSAACAAVAAALGRPAAAVRVGTGALGLLTAYEVLTRHERGSGVTGVMHDAVCTAVDLAFDAGEIVASVRQRRPLDAVRRFRYVQPQWFVPVDPRAADHRRPSPELPGRASP